MPGIDRIQPIGPADPITSHRIDQMGEIGSGLAVTTGAQSRSRSDKHGVAVAPKHNPQQPVRDANQRLRRRIVFDSSGLGSSPSAPAVAAAIANAYTTWGGGGLLPRTGDLLVSIDFNYTISGDAAFYGAFVGNGIYAFSFTVYGFTYYADALFG
jgi:hypothetical protein